MSVNHAARIVPVIKVNNRNQIKISEWNARMKSLLEEGIWRSLKDSNQNRKIDAKNQSMRLAEW